MEENQLTMAQQVAEAARAFQEQRTGHAPREATVVLSGDTLVITLHGALTPAEQALAVDPAGAARVQDFHRRLFACASDGLRQAIRRIVGVDVRESTAGVAKKTGAVPHVVSSGTTVQLFLLAGSVSAERWNGTTTEGRP